MFSSIRGTIKSAWEFTVTWQDGQVSTHPHIQADTHIYKQQDQSVRGATAHDETLSGGALCWSTHGLVSHE